MREIILGILAAEAEGARIAAEASARGRATIDAAKKKARGMLSASEAAAREAAALVLSAALEKTAREKAALLAAAEAEIEEAALLWEKNRPGAVALVLREVIGAGPRGDNDSAE